MISNLAHKQRIFASVVNLDLELYIALIIHDDLNDSCANAQIIKLFYALN